MSIIIHIRGPLVFNGTGAFNVMGIESRQLDPKSTIYKSMAAGSPYPGFSSIMGGDPTIPFTATDLKQILGNILPLSGLAIGSAPATVDAMFSKVGSSATVTSGSTHLRGRVSSGLACLKEVSWSGIEIAKAQAEIWPISADGSTKCIAFTDSVALPTLAEQEKYVGGPILLNGSAHDSIDSATLDFGLVVETKRANADVYPTFVCIKSIQPKLTIRSKSMSAFQSFSQDGSSLTSFAMYFLNKVSGGATAGASSGLHIKLSAAQAASESIGMIYCGPAASNGQDDSTVETVVEFVKGTNALLTVNTASNYP